MFVSALALIAALAITVPDAENRGGATRAPQAPGVTPVTIRLKDGSTLVARVITEDAERLRVVTLSGVSMDLPRETILSIEDGTTPAPTIRPSDTNATRLLFAPTGRPLPK